VDDILSNHADRVDRMNPYVWIWDIFAEPGSSEDEKRCWDFWDSVISAARKMMKKNLRQTEDTGLVGSAYSYLRANFGTDVCEAYTNLKQAFRISSDKDFNLILLRDEARILCDISGIDGKLIPAALDFVSEVETRSSIETSYPPFSIFQAFRQGLRYLTLVKSPSDTLSSISRRKGASLKKRRAITTQSAKNITKSHVAQIFALNQTISRKQAVRPLKASNSIFSNNKLVTAARLVFVLMSIHHLLPELVCSF